MQLSFLNQIKIILFPLQFSSITEADLKKDLYENGKAIISAEEKQGH